MNKPMIAALLAFGIGAVGLVAGPVAAVAQQATPGAQMPAKAAVAKDKAIKENPGQRAGADKCAKIDDAAKRQACVAQEAQAKKPATAAKPAAPVKKGS